MNSISPRRAGCPLSGLFVIFFLSGCAELKRSIPSTDPDLAALQEGIAQLEACEARDRDELASLSLEIDKLSDEIADIKDETTKLKVSAKQLRTQVRLLTSEWETIAAEFREAKETYDAARATATETADELQQAMADFEEATSHYRQIGTLLLLAAAWDDVGTICKGKMSTRQYRKKLEASGVDLNGKDIDHAWPRALGGVDHPWNYQPLAARLNRSLGAGVMAKLETMPLATLQGLFASALDVLVGC
jgi:hypothetical protein